VLTVHAGSTAECAGIKVGDVIVEIDGREVLNASHANVIKLLKSPAEFVTLSVVPAGHKMLLDPVDIMEQQIIHMLKRSISSNHKGGAGIGGSGSGGGGGGRTKTSTRTGPNSNTDAATALSSSHLVRVETSGWVVKKEGWLLKSTRASGFYKQVKRRYFVLKIQPQVSQLAHFAH
jgi:hypothetical protein